MTVFRTALVRACDDWVGDEAGARSLRRAIPFVMLPLPAGSLIARNGARQTM